MIQRIRKAIIDSYTGPVVIGWTLAQGVMNVIGVLLFPLTQLALRSYTRKQAATSINYEPRLTEVQIFDPVQLGLGASKALLTIGIGVALLYWLYIKPKESPVAPRTDDLGEDLVES